jgi:YHS domain-containing protein
MITKNALIVGLFLAGLVAFKTDGVGADDRGGPTKDVQKKIILQTTCPVMGGKINKALYVDHGGKRVYVCCKGCIAPLKKDPVTFITKLESGGVTVAKLQSTCPVMGGKINKKQYADVKGKRIYVCCPGCIGKIKADPATYIKKLEKDGVVLGVTPKPVKHVGQHDGHKGHNH